MKTGSVFALAVLVGTSSSAAWAQSSAGVASLSVVPNDPPCQNCLSIPSGTAVLDASQGNLAFAAPTSVRAFANASGFSQFVQQNLGGTVLYDGNGNPVGVYGKLVEYDQAYYLDWFNNPQPITDPISAYIGGLQGKFTIGSTTYQTGLQADPSLQSPYAKGAITAGKDVYQCNAAGECIAGHSFNTHWLANVHHDVGIEVTQEVGGFQLHAYHCGAFGLCYYSTGTNALSIEGKGFYDPYKLTTAPPGQYPPPPPPPGGSGASYTALARTWPLTTQSNVTRIKFSEYAWFFGAGDYAVPASIMTGACARTSSSAVTSTGASADGNILSNECYGAGVTCNANSPILCGGTTCQGYACNAPLPTAQGYKVNNQQWAPSGYNQFTAATTSITVAGQVHSENPFGASFNGDQNITVKSSTPAGYNVSSSVCMNCVSHTLDTFKTGAQVTPFLRRGDSADVWWMYRSLPVGYLEPRQVQTSTTFTGWAYDPNDTGTSLPVNVWIDAACPAYSQDPVAGPPVGPPFLSTSTTLNRPDVNAAFGIPGNHGFSFTIPTSVLAEPFQHTVCVWVAGSAPIDGLTNLSLSGTNTIQGFGCGPSNCNGCCNSDGSACLSGSSVNACGTGGNACNVCSSGSTCTNHQCVLPPPPPPFDCSQCDCGCNAAGTACRSTACTTAQANICAHQDLGCYCGACE